MDSVVSIPLFGGGIPLGIVDLAVRLQTHHAATLDHSIAVAGIARSVAWELGLSPDERDEIVLAGIMHDIGKVSLDDATLDVARELAPVEIDRAKRHPLRGARLLRRRGHASIAAIVECVADRYDGADARGGAGPIPLLAARIIAVANAYERRNSMPLVMAESGRRFDPLVVGALERSLGGRGMRLPFMRSSA